MTGHLKSFPEWRAECGMSLQTTLTADSTDANEPLAINSWTVDEWVKIPGVGATLARRLVESGPYEDVAQLVLVKGVGSKIVEAVAAQIA